MKLYDLRREVKVEGLTFTDGKLNVEAAISFASDSVFGDNSTTTTVAIDDTSKTIKVANTDRKEIIIINTTNKDVWVYYGTPAVYGKGIRLFKDDTLIEDKYRGLITAIMDTGETGNIEVTEVTL